MCYSLGGIDKSLCYYNYVFLMPDSFLQIHKGVGMTHVGYWCVKEWPTPLYSKLYETGMLLLILVYPVIIMTFAYTSMAIELRMIMSKQANMGAYG